MSSYYVKGAQKLTAQVAAQHGIVKRGKFYYYGTVKLDYHRNDSQNGGVPYTVTWLDTYGETSSNATILLALYITPETYTVLWRLAEYISGDGSPLGWDAVSRRNRYVRRATQAQEASQSQAAE
jgi:hypothetical protein